MGEGHSTEKIKNAYLLFYERIEHFNEEPVAQNKDNSTSAREEDSKEDREQLTSQRVPTDENVNSEDRLRAARKLTSDSTVDTIKLDDNLEDYKNIPPEFLQNLQEKNQKFHMHKNIFSKEYFDFFDEIIIQRQYLPNLNPHTKSNDPAIQDQLVDDLECLKFGILFMLTAIFRDKPRNGILTFLPFLKNQLKQVRKSLRKLLEIIYLRIYLPRYGCLKLSLQRS